MLAWLRSWWRRWSERPDVFHPSERFIYTYFDGKEDRRVDPLELYSKVIANWNVLRTDSNIAQSKLSAEVKLGNSGKTIAQQAYENLLAKIREIFGVAPLAKDSGLTERETLDLFDHFLVYVERIKKNSPDLPTTPNATESESTPTEATITTSDSGSTSNGSSTDAPMSLPMESVLPSG